MLLPYVTTEAFFAEEKTGRQSCPVNYILALFFMRGEILALNPAAAIILLRIRRTKESVAE
jgi:hypothetical protein